MSNTFDHYLESSGYNYHQTIRPVKSQKFYAYKGGKATEWNSMEEAKTFSNNVETVVDPLYSEKLGAWRKENHRLRSVALVTFKAVELYPSLLSVLGNKKMSEEKLEEIIDTAGIIVREYGSDDNMEQIQDVARTLAELIAKILK